MSLGKLSFAQPSRRFDSTGLQLSTYFSAIKLHWMIKNHKEVKEAYDADDLAFGTVDSWVVYVRRDPLIRNYLL